MERHIKILAILNIVWGAFGALGGLIILLIFGGAFGIVGTAVRHDPDAARALPIIGLVGGAIALLVLLLSVPSIVAGVGLLDLKPWSRILTIIVSALHLLNIPFGTALGIYGLWVLFSQGSLPYFTSPPKQASYPKL
ncbi:MAG: hypothetical protein AB1898_25475 [Acidobacteriota bacterium]